MGTNLEIQVEQKRRLYLLLKIKKNNPDVEISDLDEAIRATRAEMSQEDVAYVEKIIAET